MPYASVDTASSAAAVSNAINAHRSISGILLFVNDALALIGQDGFVHWQVFLFIFMAAFVGLFG